jgi:aspartate/methionine/tyrosine aminotransferase
LPLDRAVVGRVVGSQPFELGQASIRQMHNLVEALEHELAIRFVRMEFGIPGLPLHPKAIEAERRALGELGVGHVYAPFEGLPALKREAARFFKLFANLDLPPESCIPTVGAMQGCFASILLASRMYPDRRTVLCLEPGFPVNKLQIRLLGLERSTIDFYDHRGDALLRAIDARARRGDLCAVLWSSPNNPSWIVLDEHELEGLARICTEHDLLAIEDLAYFGMDVRCDYLTPGRPPYQPTVLRYTDSAVSVVSSSKMFSYAGQRVAITILPPRLFAREQQTLVQFYGTSRVGHAFLHGGLYPITASVPHAPQYGLLALFEAANAGDRSVFAPAVEYARRAKIMKRVFLENGFTLVYDNDQGRPLADGFYFTVAYPAFDDGATLLAELLSYGVSAITLATTGSCRKEGLRACVSLVGDEEIVLLSERLACFRRDHPV